MAGVRHFDKLVSNLSLDERQNLLTKLKGQSSMSSKEALYFDEETSAPVSDIETQYSKLPWFYRLWYFILSIIKSRPPVKIFEDHQVYTLGNKAEERSPGLYDYQRVLLLPSFCRQLEGLREASRFFYSALDISVNRDRGAFFAFLGSLEMPSVHKRLYTDTDPLHIIEKNPDSPETELRQIAYKAMENALMGITEECREAMYFDARSLNCLRELSSFLFDRILMAFSSQSSTGGGTCPAGAIRELLVSLNNILLSLKTVPTMPLLESLFIFILQEKADEQGFDINREIRTLLTKAEEALTVIRDFNKNVPLTWIIRCSIRNMSITPKEISGGEDWLLVYRDYWKHRIESLLAVYIKDKRQKELQNSFQTFLKGHNLTVLINAQSDLNPEALPLRGDFALSFLNTFYSVVFLPDINKFLRPILIDGEFVKQENHAEFVEGYNNLIKLEDDIKKLDKAISTSGEYGKRYAQARKDMTSLSIKRRKIQIVLQEAAEDASKILEQIRDASRNMVNIINGILGRGSKSKYDSLTNLSKLAGRDNQFNLGLSESAAAFQTLNEILEEIDVMESGR